MHRYRACAFCRLCWASALADKTPERLEVTSAFPHGGAIQSQYTCDGADVVPPVRWSAVPPGTRSIAILVDDPDAPNGKFTHWLVTGIPPTRTGQASGPCPPSGHHRYEFRVYALDTTLPVGITRSEFVNAITGHIVATGHVIWTYRRLR